MSTVVARMKKVVAVFIFVTTIFVLFLTYISHVTTDNFESSKFINNVSSSNVFPNDIADNLFWFVQVTDIHISRYRDFNRAPDLRKLCDTHFRIIKPDFVIVSGDLTDAKFRDLKGSKQFVDEWKSYHKTLFYCKKFVNNWLDLRGNHDAFDTPDHDHADNLFRVYSSQGRDNPTSYMYHHVKKFGRYSFIGIDASPNPGPKRPLNFFGYLKQDAETAVRAFINQSRNSNMTIAFGHYPSSLIPTQSGNSIRDLLRDVTAYLCGHLHTLSGLVRQMYVRHRTGMLELELGDWKDERIYRVLAVDHDMLSFTDVVLDHWPVVMVTNPKKASFQVPFHEPLHRMNKSTHIRMLVFTPGNVSNIEVYIDDIHQDKAVHSDGPLFVLPWKPDKFVSGLHTMKIIIEDSWYGLHLTEHVFSLDGTRVLLPFTARFMLMVDIVLLVKTGFFLLVAIYIVVLVLLRQCNNMKCHLSTNHHPLLQPLLNFFNTWLYRLWLVAKVTKLYCILIGFVLYVAFGPWFVGEVLAGQSGVVFIWGMFVQGTYVPVFLTYLYGVFQVVTFNIPLTFFLGYHLHYFHTISQKQTVFHQARNIYVPFIALILLQTYIALSEFPGAYGKTALVLGPVRTGSVILAICLYAVAMSVNNLYSVNHVN